MPPKGWKKPAKVEAKTTTSTTPQTTPVKEVVKPTVKVEPPSERDLRIALHEGIRAYCFECGTDNVNVASGELEFHVGSDGLLPVFRCQPCVVKRLVAMYAIVSENGRKLRAANEAK